MMMVLLKKKLCEDIRLEGFAALIRIRASDENRTDKTLLN
jgi:hypothetical protein